MRSEALQNAGSHAKTHDFEQLKKGKLSKPSALKMEKIKKDATAQWCSKRPAKWKRTKGKPVEIKTKAPG